MKGEGGQLSSESEVFPAGRGLGGMEFSRRGREVLQVRVVFQGKREGGGSYLVRVKFSSWDGLRGGGGGGESFPGGGQEFSRRGVFQ